MVANTGFTLICGFTNPSTATDPVGTVMNVTMQVDPLQTATSELFVPITENWVISDMYISASGDATTGDPIVLFIKDRGNTMGKTTILSAQLVSNNTRPRFLPTAIGFEAGTILTMQAISTVIYGTTVETGKFWVAIDIT